MALPIVLFLRQRLSSKKNVEFYDLQHVLKWYIYLFVLKCQSESRVTMMSSSGNKGKVISEWALFLTLCQKLNCP